MLRLASALIVCLLAWIVLAQPAPRNDAQLWRHRNLGKAFYENPATQAQERIVYALD